MVKTSFCERSNSSFLLACLSSFVFKVWHSDFYKDSNRLRSLYRSWIRSRNQCVRKDRRECGAESFLTIGSNKGKAAFIEDDVYIAPFVCLVEDVVIGRGSVVGLVVW